MDALLLVSGFLLLALGFAMGRVWEWERGKHRRVLRFRCCDHCYLEDGEPAHDRENFDAHAVPCGEIVNGMPCPVGNSLV